MPLAQIPRPFRGGLAGFALLGLLVAPAAAQDTRKDELVNDPAVRQSLQPENTPLGRSPPSNLPGESGGGLQQSIDRAHEGTTGSTAAPGQSRDPGNQPPNLQDGKAPHTTYQPTTK